MDQSSDLTELGGALREILNASWAFLPQLLAALFVLLVGWILARVLKALSVRAQAAAQRLAARLPGSTAAAIDLRIPPRLVPNLVYWAVLLAFVAAATQLLGLSLFSDWLSALLTQVPGLLAAALVVFGGIVTGQLSRDLVAGAATSAGLHYPHLLGGATQLTLLALSAIIGLELLGLDSTFLTVIAGLIIGMIGGAIALAFGLGARTQVSNLLGARDAREHYQPGERIQVDRWEGVILDITPRAVLLDTAEGRLRIPTHLFAELPSVLLADDDD